MNTLFFGDNLDVMRERIPSDSVDLIYLDPPFNSKATYNIVYKSPVGADAQRKAFEDTWRWEDGAEAAMEGVRRADVRIFQVLRALQGFLGQSDVMAYLAMMTVRLLEMRRVLRSTGSIYLHCDPTASHYLKIVLDAIFGQQNFRGEIIWRRTNARATTGRWPRLHDTLLHYSKSDAFVFRSLKVKADENKLPHTLITGKDGKKYQTYELTGPGVTKDGESGRPWRGFNPAKYGRHWANSHGTMDMWEEAGLIHWPAKNGFPRRKSVAPFDPSQREVVVGDVWTDIDRINQSSKERLGYPTQKPLALLERIISASSNAGDTILDPFCGCGTAIHAAERLNRNWIGIDITYLAIQVIEDRIKTWLPATKYAIEGIPKDEFAARKLAERDPYVFQEWAVGRVGGQPRGRGPDKGIDGEIAFIRGPGRYGRAIVSVKGGKNVGPDAVRILKAVVEREDADMGVFICLNDPTADMRTEAALGGRIVLPGGERAKIQIVTAADLARGPNLGILTELNIVTATLAARTEKRKKPPKSPTPEELRAQPPLPPMPIKGGKAGKQQPTLPLDEPILVQPKEVTRRKRS